MVAALGAVFICGHLAVAEEQREENMLTSLTPCGVTEAMPEQ